MNDLEKCYNGMRSISVQNEKGGVGKTTVALHLAVQLAVNPKYKKRFPKKILVVDLDDQQNMSAMLLEMESVAGFAALVPPLHPYYDSSDPDHVEWGGRSNSIDLYYGNPVLPYPTSLSDRLDILPSDGNMLKTFEDDVAAADQTLTQKIFNEIRAWMSDPEVQAEYSAIIIDCPPGRNIITGPVMRASTDIIIVTECEQLSVLGAKKLVKQIHLERDSGERTFPLNIAGIIPNKFDKRMLLHKTLLQDLKNQYGDLLKPTPVMALADLKLVGMPIDTVDLVNLKGAAKKEIHSLVSFLYDGIVKQRGLN